MFNPWGPGAGIPEIPGRGQSALAMRGLYFKAGDSKVLLDPGPGKWIGSFFPGYHFSGLHNAFDLLKNEGIVAEEITDIFLTHLHFDHCAGVFIREGQILRPAFPGATLHLSREQYDLIGDPSDEEKDSFLPGFTQLIDKYYKISFCEKARVPLFLDDIIFSHGHSRGMALPVFHVAGKKYIYVSDLIPTCLHLERRIVSGYDTDPSLLFVEKEAFLDTFTGRGYSIILFHESVISKREILL